MVEDLSLLHDAHCGEDFLKALRKEHSRLRRLGVELVNEQEIFIP
jgi:hypothetical protein